MIIMSYWEYNTVCCGAYAKADYTNTNLYVIDSKQYQTLFGVIGMTPPDYIQTMGLKGWQLICQTPDVPSSGCFVTNEVLFSFKRPAGE